MRIFGEIKGTAPGIEFKDRGDLAKAGIHLPRQAGISGSGKEGADSIVLSGGYEDDQDFGNEIIYTGSGGQDDKNNQVQDQVLTRTNLALAKSKIDGLPVRVTRGHHHKSPYSPISGYKYAGIYYVEDYWQEKGRLGFVIWRYRLVSDKNLLSSGLINETGSEYKGAERKEALIQRIVRDSLKAKKIKKWHNYQCQVCNVTLETSAGLYAEAAHIKPLGTPHDGPDIESNILCLCPNHHVLFDNGGFTINNDFTLNRIDGRLRLLHKHNIDIKFIEYHRTHYQKNA